MTFNQLLTFIAAVIIANALMAAGFLYLDRVDASPTAGNFEVGIGAMARSATVSVGTASTGVASSSSGRRFLQIQNTSSSVTVFCAYSGTTAAVGTQGFFIAASSTFSLPVGDGPMYTGPLNCIASSTVALLVNEG